jgi:hypothetical protein
MSFTGAGVWANALCEANAMEATTSPAPKPTSLMTHSLSCIVCRLDDGSNQNGQWTYKKLAIF